MDVAVRAEADQLKIVAQIGVERRLAGRDHGRRTRREGREQLGLGGGDRLDRPEQLEVGRPDVDDHPDLRLTDRREQGDLAGAAHRQLEHERLGPGGGPEDRQRQPDLGVVVARAGHRFQHRSENPGEDVLGRRLAGRPGDRDDAGPRATELPPPGQREGLESGQRVVDRQDDAARCVRGCGGRAGGGGGGGRGVPG